jgi:hypothetical protein
MLRSVTRKRANRMGDAVRRRLVGQALAALPEGRHFGRIVCVLSDRQVALRLAKREPGEIVLCRPSHDPDDASDGDGLINPRGSRAEKPYFNAIDSTSIQ